MITLCVLDQIDLPTLQAVMSGYRSDWQYTVRWEDTSERTLFSLERTRCDPPYQKRFDHLDEETVERYRAALPAGFSFGAWAEGQLAGVLLAEPRFWNSSVWVWEFHVAGRYQGQGIGRQLMEALAARGRVAGLRTLVCETQNTNAPAIQAYRRLGFQLEGLDISYYSNQDYPAGEVALFMKRRLDGL